MNHAKTPFKTISPDDLICMNDYADTHPIVIRIAYARDDNLLFGERIYSQVARLFLHRDLAKIVLSAARKVFKDTNGVLVLYDGLRVVEAQQAMLETQRVQDNPQWLEEPRLLSPPGAGGHPRAMAIDVSIQSADGSLLDMGTEFDYLAENSAPDANPAHRDYAHSDHIQANRKLLDDAMLGAAKEAGITMIALPQEWGDFRVPASVYEQYAPLSDGDLPDHMKIMD